MSGAVLWNPHAFTSTGDPTTVDEATPFTSGQLGTVYPVLNTTLFATGGVPRIFQYVLRDSSDATTLATNGGVAHWVSYLLFKVTQDESAALGGTGSNHVAGVFFAAKPTAGQYGFIQVGGIGPVNVKGSPTAAAAATGQPLIPTSTDGEADCIADWNDSGVRAFAKTMSAKNDGSIGTNVVKAILLVDRVGW